MSENFGTATPRQRWALFCITKKDYREVELSKEEAAKLISEFGNKDYVKKTKKQTLSEELLSYLKNNFDNIFKEASKSLKFESIIEDDPLYKPKEDCKRYAFVGVGCSITYPKYRRTKSMVELMKAASQYRMHEIQNMFLNKFNKSEHKYYEKIGCPLAAIWQQDQNMQNIYWEAVKDFCSSKGKTISIVSYLD